MKRNNRLLLINELYFYMCIQSSKIYRYVIFAFREYIDIWHY
jgi:hypothetical protein